MIAFSGSRYLLVGVLAIMMLSPAVAADDRNSRRKKSTREQKTPAATIFNDLQWGDDEVPGDLVPLHSDCRNGAEKDLTLNLLRFGKDAFRKGHTGLSAKAFDHALDRMEVVIAEDVLAKKARSKFRGEDIKSFKGEPFERSLAYLYRGILFMQEGDFQNARACFRGGQLADTARDMSFSGDYVLLYYLEGKCNQALGDVGGAKEAFRWAADSYERMYFKPPLLPAMDPVNSILILVESGPAPLKYGFGRHNQELGYARQVNKLTSQSCALYINGQRVAALDQPIENTFYQAVTRGPRVADSYNRGKAAFKDFTAVAGGIGVAAGATIMSRADSGGELAAGAAVMLLGALFMATSESTAPNADIRQWDNLPDSYYLFVVEADEGFDAYVEYLNLQGTPVAVTRLGWITPSETYPLIVHACEGSSIVIPDPIKDGFESAVMTQNTSELSDEQTFNEEIHDIEPAQGVMPGTAVRDASSVQSVQPLVSEESSVAENLKDEEDVKVSNIEAKEIGLKFGDSPQHVEEVLGKPDDILDFKTGQNWYYRQRGVKVIIIKGEFIACEDL